MTPKERAAKAVDPWLETLCMDGNIRTEARDEVARGAANAALAAIAELSDAMIDAMKNSCWNSLTDDDARKVWRAAHAAMMAEKDTGE